MDQQNKPEAISTEEQALVSPEETPSVQDENIEVPVPAAPIIDVDDDEDEDSEDKEPEIVLTPFQEKIAAIPEDKWKKYQIIGGLILGALTVFALFYRQDKNSGTMSYGFLIAICLALFGPNYLEKQGKRDILFGRKIMCITMAVGMVIAILILGFSTGWNIFEPVAG